MGDRFFCGQGTSPVRPPPPPIPRRNTFAEFWTNLATPRSDDARRKPFKLSPMPSLSPPPQSARVLARGIMLKQIGDGSYLPLASPARPTTTSPRRTPLLGGEAQRAIHSDRCRAIERCDTARRLLFKAELAREEQRRVAEEARQVAMAEGRDAAEKQRLFSERLARDAEERLKWERKERKRERQERHIELYGRKGSGREVVKDQWAWMGGSSSQLAETV